MKVFIATLVLICFCAAVADEADAARGKMIQDGIKVCQKRGLCNGRRA